MTTIKQFCAKSLSVRHCLHDHVFTIHQNYAEDADDQLVQEAFKAIGSISLSIPASSQQCLNALLGFIQSKYGITVPAKP
jgi:vesicle coat complex subunit